MEYKEYNGNKVTLLPCSDCNAKCKHCYVSARKNLNGDELINIVKKLVSSGYEVDLNGTEPLLHRDYIQSFQYIGQTRVMTNGLVFKDNFEYLDDLKKSGITTINTSYHFSLHSIISPVPKDYLLQLWAEIQKRGMRFTINCTLSTHNYLAIDEICDETYELGARRIRFTNLIRQGNSTGLDQRLFLNCEQLNYTIEKICSCRSHYSPSALYIERCGSFGPGSNHRKFFCPAGIDRVFIATDAKVYPCVFLSRPGDEIGYYENGHIYIDAGFSNDSTRCLALDLLNGNYAINAHNDND